MVRLCLAGGRLSADIGARFEQAARFYAQGDFGTAAARYHEILGLSPHHPEALSMLGIIAQRAGKSALALTLFDDAIAAKPGFPRAYFNRSVVLRAMGRDEEALQSARQAAEGAPDLAEAWDLLGQMLKDKGAFADAAACHECAISQQPGNAFFRGHYALLQFAQGRLVEACRTARRAEELDPRWPPMILGNILQAMGYPQQAAERFARMRALRPDFPDAAVSEAMARLQIGDMERGWALWERRPSMETALNALPLWQGQQIGRLLLYEDQGMGDAIQFARYIPSLKNRAGHLTLRLCAPLQRLFAENFSDIDLIADTDPAPAAEARYRLSSLPFFFKTGLGSIPATPYMTASPERRAFWRGILQPLPAPRIGLVWAGNVHFRHDAKRSVDSEILRPLLACGAAHFVSMQKDRADTDDFLAASGLFDAAPRLRDFADTAGLIAELDLVITVDTAAAHLAGALGKPVFVLLPFSSDWRWLLGREDSPWYGGVRLFRQKKSGDWAGVIEAAAHEAKKLMAGDRSVLRPAPWREEPLRQHPDALPLPF